MSTGEFVESQRENPKDGAVSAVDRFTNANNIVLGLSIIGAVVIAIVGLVPQCPVWEGAYCYDSDKVNNLTLTAIGLAYAIVSWWIWAFGQLVSARVALAADQAK
jgi:hypothetical protein